MSPAHPVKQKKRQSCPSSVCGSNVIPMDWRMPTHTGVSGASFSESTNSNYSEMLSPPKNNVEPGQSMATPSWHIKLMITGSDLRIGARTTLLGSLHVLFGALNRSLPIKATQLAFICGYTNRDVASRLQNSSSTNPEYFLFIHLLPLFVSSVTWLCDSWNLCLWLFMRQLFNFPLNWNALSFWMYV